MISTMKGSISLGKKTFDGPTGLTLYRQANDVQPHLHRRNLASSRVFRWL